jgi:hypothetical protein
MLHSAWGTEVQTIRRKSLLPFIGATNKILVSVPLTAAQVTIHSQILPTSNYLCN